MLPGFAAESPLDAPRRARGRATLVGSPTIGVVPQAINLGRAHARCTGRCTGEYIGGGVQCAAGLRSDLDCALLGQRFSRCTGMCDLLYG